MQGELEVTLRNPREPELYQRVLRSVLEETNHLATISEALLLLARIEAGELAPRTEDTDVGGLVERAVGRIRQRATDHPIAYGPGTGTVGSAAVDPGMVGLVLDHLLDNAIRHTPPGTPVHVAIDGGRGEVAVTISDEGPGVPADMLPHLFERFYRGDSARGRGGAGLGLTVAAAIVQAHGGTIEAQPAAPSGLRMIVRLPRHPSARSAT
jgi:two-component system OmpR family sensor kinase